MITLFNLFKILKECKKKEAGATAGEYAILIVFIAAVIVGIVTALGSRVFELFQVPW